LEFTRLKPNVYFIKTNQLQIRVHGKWLPELCLPNTEDAPLLFNTNKQQLIFDFPAETEACRFHLGYQTGSFRYCRTYYFLYQHGISQKMPAISNLILKSVPRRSKIRFFDSEVALSTSTNH